jgi:hypothetical protein
LLLAGGACRREEEYGFPRADLSVAGKRLRGEVAATPSLRYRGYRLRREIPEGTGMIFLFPREELHTFVMTDTLVPLSIAFIDREGKIFQIEDMNPLDEKRTYSVARALYALEVPQGWFTKNGIAVGARVEGLEELVARFPPE